MLVKNYAGTVKLLSLIFHSSFQTGILPLDWKTAGIMPIYQKKVPRIDAMNYRLISLTLIAGKIMESLIREQIVTYIYIHMCVTYIYGSALSVLISQLLHINFNFCVLYRVLSSAF